MATMELSGVLTQIPTPFDQRDEIDLGRLRAALAGWVSTPLAGFVVLGSNGEAALLDEDESDRVVGAAREIVPAGRTFIVGAGRESTRATVAAAARAAALGADAVLVRTPGFFKAQMTADVFVQHYTAVADASPVPVLLYNFTAVTGVTLPVDAVAALSRHPNIVGMKESGSDVGRTGDLVAATPDGFHVLAGSASTFHASLAVGATGGILALGLVAPEACVRLFELTNAGRQDEARTLQQRLLPLAALLGSMYGVPGLKAALKLVGRDTGWPRPPLVPLGQTAVTELAEALRVLADDQGLLAVHDRPRAHVS
jgi:4-hydroxy-2-oxoglutarate aldolase